jgi:transposase InsO family protein
VHSRPGQPQGRGKIERWFRTVRDQFLVEITPEVAAGITGLAEINRLLRAWVETVYHPTTHSKTGAPPLRRWREGIAWRCAHLTNRGSRGENGRPCPRFRTSRADRRSFT